MSERAPASETRTDYTESNHKFTIPVDGEPTDVTLFRHPFSEEEAWAGRAFVVETVAAAAADVPRSERPGTVRMFEDRDLDDVGWTAGGDGDVVAVDPTVDEGHPVARGLDAVTPGDGDHVDRALVTREDGDTYAYVPHAAVGEVYADVAGVDDLDTTAFDRGIELIRGAVAPSNDLEATPGSVEAAIDRATTAMFGPDTMAVSVDRAVDHARDATAVER